MDDLEAVMEHHELTAGEWLTEAGETLRRVCETQQYVTVASLWPQLGFPPSPKDGRVIGKVIRAGIKRGWIEKCKTADGFSIAVDHVDMPEVRSRDGRRIRTKALVPLYRSTLYPR